MTHRITVVGAGFAGLSAIRELRRRDPQAEITLVAPRAELHYLPGIIWIPSGLRRREDLVIGPAVMLETGHGTLVVEVGGLWGWGTSDVEVGMDRLQMLRDRKSTRLNSSHRP